MTTTHLPSEPLLAAVAARGGARACGVRQKSAEEAALARARRLGYVTERAADRLAVRLLGVTPWSLWGDAVADQERLANGHREWW